MNFIVAKLRAWGVALATFTLASFACATDIGNASDFVSKLTADPNGDYALTADIDLTGSGYATIPLFSGKLNGQGHAITGLGTVSLFNIFAGSVNSLVIDGAGTTRTAADVGIFCNQSYAGKFTDVVIKGYTLKHSTAGGQKSNGLFAAYAYDGSTFIRCATDSSCSMNQNGKANNHQGGLVGKCLTKLSPSADFLFEDCTNNAAIVATGNYNDSWGDAGIVGHCIMGTKAPVPRCVFRRCVNNAAISTTGGKGNLGGIVGWASGSGARAHSNRYYFLDCLNRGDVTSNVEHTGVGGIVGRMDLTSSAIVDGCLNVATIGGSGCTGSVGGIAGFLGNYLSDIAGADNLTFRNCENRGAVSGQSNAGGIAGKAASNTGWANGIFHFVNCGNYGTLTVESGDSAEICAYLNYNNVASNAGWFDNCWGLSTTYCKTMPNTQPTITNCKSPADATACADLNAIAANDLTYMPWIAGTDGYPHLAAFSDSSASEFIVCFRDWNGDILKKQTVTKGGSATPPANPSRDDYVFTKWVGGYSNVQAFSIVTADYEPGEVTVTFDAAGGFGGTSVVTKLGTYVVPPAVTLPKHAFASWAYNSTATDFYAPGCDGATFVALWRKNMEPYVKKITFLTWHMKSCNATNCEKRGDALKVVFDEHDVDVATIVGLTSSGTQMNTILAKLPGYAYEIEGCNGTSDGTSRTIFWKTNMLESCGAGGYVMPTSNSSIGYKPLKWRNKQLILLPMAAFYGATKTIEEYVKAFPSARASLETKYPTAVQLLGTDFKQADGTAKLTSVYTDWAGLRDAFVASNGYTELQAADDYQWAFVKSPWDPSSVRDVTCTKVENAENQDQPGYVINFGFGVYDAPGMVITGKRNEN